MVIRCNVWVCNLREESTCHGLAEAMREHPETFNGFEIEYIINGQRSARRQVRITGDNVMSGKLHSQLVNMPAARGGVRYLSSDDINTMIYESMLNVVGSVVSDSDYVDTGDDVSVTNLISRELTREQVASTELRPKMWESVFWNPAFARPDRLTHSLNKMLSTDSMDNSSLIFTEQSSSQVSILFFIITFLYLHYSTTACSYLLAYEILIHILFCFYRALLQAMRMRKEGAMRFSGS